jgi:hypothetical protein
MATKKRTVITEETHEVWIIRPGEDTDEPATSTDSEGHTVFEPIFALEPIDPEQE